jgi:hypothetical protein
MLGLSAPRDMKQDWNKAPAIWFPRWAELAAKQSNAAQWPARLRIGAMHDEATGCAFE